jgi:hypothetical protein
MVSLSRLRNPKLYQIAGAAACVCAALISIWSAFSADAEAASVFVSPARQDLGRLKQLQTVQSETLLVNNTLKTIRIESIDATCGCTKVHAETDVLVAGSSTKLQAEIQTGQRRGDFSSLMTVNYVCPDTEAKGTVAWLIQAAVETEYIAEPESLVFTRQSENHQQIHLASRTVPNFMVSTVTCSHKCLRASYARGASPEKWTIDVHFGADAGAFPVGRHWLTVSTNAPVQRELMIPISVVDAEGLESATPKSDQVARGAP